MKPGARHPALSDMQRIEGQLHHNIDTSERLHRLEETAPGIMQKAPADVTHGMPMDTLLSLSAQLDVLVPSPESGTAGIADQLVAQGVSRPVAQDLQNIAESVATDAVDLLIATVESPVATPASPVAAAPAATSASPVATSAPHVATAASPVATHASPVAAAPVATSASPVATTVPSVATAASPAATAASPVRKTPKRSHAVDDAEILLRELFGTCDAPPHKHGRLADTVDSMPTAQDLHM